MLVVLRSSSRTVARRLVATVFLSKMMDSSSEANFIPSHRNPASSNQRCLMQQKLVSPSVHLQVPRPRPRILKEIPFTYNRPELWQMRPDTSISLNPTAAYPLQTNATNSGTPAIRGPSPPRQWKRPVRQGTRCATGNTVRRVGRVCEGFLRSGRRAQAERSVWA